MPRFPRTETDLVPFVEQMLDGVASYPDVFANADAKGLDRAFEAYRVAKEKQMVAFEAYKAATEPKERALDALIEKTKLELKQAEIDARNDPEKLKHIGWGWTTTVSEELKAPGAPTNLTMREQGGVLQLSWEPPQRGSGGRVQAYEVERCPEGVDDWRIVTVVFETEAVLHGEPAGNFDYRVAARNKKGASAPSSSVARRSS